ncbi:hypothetical protein H5410_015319, partial [Solanum commersonii]
NLLHGEFAKCICGNAFFEELDQTTNNDLQSMLWIGKQNRADVVAS